MLPGVEDSGEIAKVSAGDEGAGAVDNDEASNGDEGDDWSRVDAESVVKVTDFGSARASSRDSSLAPVGVGITCGIVKTSTHRSAAMRRVTAKDGVDVARVSAGCPSRSCESTRRTHSQVAHLEKKVASLPKVPRAPLPVATGSEDVVDVDMGRQELAAGVGGWRGTKKFNGLYQPVPNQGLQIAELVSVEKYLEEGWHDSKRFAALPHSGTLLSVTNVRGHNVLTRASA